MDVQPRDVRLYLTKEGKAPFLDWLNSLRDVQARAIIRARLNRVRLGNFGDCRSVGEGIFELRIDFGPGYRVYFAESGTQTVILLCSGQKGTQRRDIRRAQRYWLDYRSREDA